MDTAVAHSLPALSIANAFLTKAKERGQSVTPMKLQKLIFFAHGWYLALLSLPLIDEQVEAWKFGPVIKSVYDEFKGFGSKAITSKATDIDWESLSFVPFPEPEDAEIKSIIDKIWDVYGNYTAIQLSNMTHEAGTPWHQVWREDLPRGTDIPDGLIKTYFESLVSA